MIAETFSKEARLARYSNHVSEVNIGFSKRTTQMFFLTSQLFLYRPCVVLMSSKFL